MSRLALAFAIAGALSFLPGQTAAPQITGLTYENFLIAVAGVRNTPILADGPGTDRTITLGEALGLDAPDVQALGDIAEATRSRVSFLLDQMQPLRGRSLSEQLGDSDQKPATARLRELERARSQYVQNQVRRIGEVLGAAAFDRIDSYIRGRLERNDDTVRFFDVRLDPGVH